MDIPQQDPRFLELKRIISEAVRGKSVRRTDAGNVETPSPDTSQLMASMNIDAVPEVPQPVAPSSELVVSRLRLLQQENMRTIQ